MESTHKEREEIIEMFGIHFESVFEISPLAGRILGILIVDGCRTGLTFENLIEKLGASKSSISTNLNLLLKMEKITYFTIAGDRKKYYKPAPLSDRLSSYLKMLKSEQLIIDKMIHYREKTVSCSEEQFSLDNAQFYKTHLEQVEDLIVRTIAEFKETETINKQ
ncbi:GbsR/MarR family transcriptional regulator [Flavobacterium ardleyense]|uniref:GbsR/MarR family transcriptional regulator n=1 Tax=Flavobacterium ardleyense TaxID=2038737 RepID=A0ABW5ZAC2_9FLAO